MSMMIGKSKQNAAALPPHVLTVGNTADVELVRHTYMTSKNPDDLTRIVVKYLDDCECDYDYSEVDAIVDGLRDEEYARLGNHFFRLTEPENA